MAKTILGRLPREAIRMLDLPRLPQDMLEGYRRLVDLTGTVSDAMDELGVVGVVPAYVLPPVSSGKRIVGPALTVRNIQRTEQIHKAALDKTNTQGETEAHNLAEPGDVLVIEGITARCRSAACRCGPATSCAQTRRALPSCRASGQPRCWKPRAR